MKLLFLANRIPYPPYRGDKLKIYNLARRLSARHELYLLTFTETEEDKGYKPELESIFKEVHLIHQPRWKSGAACLAGIGKKLPFQVLYFQSEAMQQTLDRLLETHHFDAVHVQHLLLKSILDFLRCRLCELFRVVHVQSFPTTPLNIRMPDAI
ncbi:MAG: hypothetical protein EOP49_44075 [Sphingobacteriales bacterium]|nr:MAG: hypothetical protein EOP49_44075 [Sphingobacteriales bacterium]